MAKNDTSITTIDDAPKPEPAANVATINLSGADDALSGAMVELTIGQGEGDIGKEPVFIGVNGNNLLVPRGVRCKVPVEYAEVIDNAVMVISESMGLVKNERDIARFSTTTRAIASPA